jgi:hypothetical protein
MGQLLLLPITPTCIFNLPPVLQRRDLYFVLLAAIFLAAVSAMFLTADLMGAPIVSDINQLTRLILV